MNRKAALLLAVLTVGTPAVAAAQEGAPTSYESGWLLNGANVGAGRTALLGEIGWPGLGLTLLHGNSSRFDIGAYGFFNYGFEGVTYTGAVPGLKAGAVLRLGLINKPKFNLGVRLMPGFELYFESATRTAFGLTIPVAVLAGVNFTNQFGLHFGAEFPLVIFFTPELSFLFPFEPAVGFEYKVDNQLSLTVDARVGPAFGSSTVVRNRTLYAPLAVRFMFGLGYRF